jgi:hypothetical protein
MMADDYVNRIRGLLTQHDIRTCPFERRRKHRAVVVARG